jgi:hypothetical protein
VEENVVVGTGRLDETVALPIVEERDLSVGHTGATRALWISVPVSDLCRREGGRAATMRRRGVQRGQRGAGEGGRDADAGGRIQAELAELVRPLRRCTPLPTASPDRTKVLIPPLTR